VTAEDPEIAAAADAFLAADEEALLIKTEWAIVAVKGCFYPAAKFVHPAYAVSDEESEQVAPQMQMFLQMVADKYAPAMVARLANRYPEFWDLFAALGVLYYQKWRAVSKLIAEEQRARAEAGETAKRVEGKHVTVMPSPEPAEQPQEPERKVVGERMRDGSLVI
jgi:hypothetical protein